MNKKEFKTYYLFKIIISLILFYATIRFENAVDKRIILLGIVFAIYIGIGIIRQLLLKNYNIYIFTFLLDIGIIYFLEYNSKYLINYFIHSFYLLILLETSILLKRRASLSVNIVVLLVSLIKYAILINYRRNLGSISEMVFFAVISIFIIVIISFSQYYKEEKEKKDELYSELLDAHKSLKEYSEEVERLAAIEERNRIARDIHDTLGHDMTALLMQLEIACRFIESDVSEAKNILLQLKDSTRNNLVKVRKIVETLNPYEDISTGIKSLKELTKDFSSKTSIKVELTINGDVVKANPSVNIALYRIIQESMTNAVRHGKATEINIVIEYLSDKIGFKIYNNGLIKGNIIEGFGLKGMRERVKDLNGYIDFITEKEFTVKGFLSLEV